MWRVLLDLLTAARRPLVVVDFEATGLGPGATPVEFAVLIWAPWQAPQDDATTRAVRPLVPPGLTYACVQRLDPGQPIDPGATAVHGIKDADVRGVAGVSMWNDLSIRAVFRSLADGDADENEGPAVWCGHNAQNADLAWMRRWGYLPATEVDAIDTFRLARRLAKEMPHPMNVDVVDKVGESFPIVSVPALDWGLDAFAATLAGAHVAMLGERPTGAHGALSDCAATSRVLARALDLWSPLWPPKRADVPASANLTALLACLDTPEPGAVSWDGWLEGDPESLAGTGYVWRKGKFKGQPAHRDAYVLDLPRAPTGIAEKSWWCSQHTADILTGLRPVAVVR